MLPRRIWPALLCLTATTAIALTSLGQVFIGPPQVAPRLLLPLEYGPMLLAIALCVGLAPRFADWDRYGSTRTRTTALATLALSVTVPNAFFLILLTLPLPVYAEHSLTPNDLLPLTSNITVAGLLAYCLTATLGRLLGTVLWATTLHLLLMWQATVPSFVHLLPLTMHLTPQSTPDTAIRWTWILLLVLAASTLAYTRRAIPLRLSLRTQDPHA